MKTLSFLPQTRTAFLLTLFIWTSLLSCTNKQEVATDAAESQVQFTPPNIPAPEEPEQQEAREENIETGQNAAIPAQIKIIRNASLRFQVQDYRKSIRNIETLVKRYQGFVVNSNESRIDNSLQNTLSIRVPSRNLDNLVEALAKEAIFLDYKNISSEDVSTEFVDISARLKAKQAVEQRYLDLLKQAKTIKDILEIENQLRQIREEIESVQARINYINSQVAYSTVSVEIYENRSEVSEGNSFWVRILNALKNGWDMLLSFIVGLLYIWPFILLLALITFVLKKFFRKHPPVR
ncbi:DUF4349 domain-containing protein [Adhaeribacter soli]|uniref:DUF4349 domain-containing protein n=1 Tax=Adhaeribacter soli TaxID=2607655 RepID=A0A5N1IXN0_9BACT|nr:DUF4349 domain-containing protein [Adhaeribacter soli]KAA9338858.1 DUF4349 domain-containing protein [Adhaeribacter soli]